MSRKLLAELLSCRLVVVSAVLLGAAERSEGLVLLYIALWVLIEVGEWWIAHPVWQSTAKAVPSVLELVWSLVLAHVLELSWVLKLYAVLVLAWVLVLIVPKVAIVVGQIAEGLLGLVKVTIVWRSVG